MREVEKEGISPGTAKDVISNKGETQKVMNEIWPFASVMGSSESWTDTGRHSWRSSNAWLAHSAANAAADQCCETI